MVASEQHLYQTIVLPRKIATGIIHDYLFCYCALVGILLEVMRIDYARWWLGNESYKQVSLLSMTYHKKQIIDKINASHHYEHGMLTSYHQVHTINITCVKGDGRSILVSR